MTEFQVSTIDVSPGSVKNAIDESSLRGFLNEMSYPKGLQEVVVLGLQKIPFRYFILDDSGSMSEPDGHIVVKKGKEYAMTDCSRWNELIESLKFHVDLAASSGTTAQFRFLNNAAPVTISPEDKNSIFQLKRLFDTVSPGGGTPLCHHIRAVVPEIKTIETTLRSSNQKVCIIIATDGEASDGNILDAMKPLETLPCFVVVRLCTNDKKVVDYWNSIDEKLEIELDILDDFKSEAEQINRHNEWFTYGEPLHRVREFGIPLKELDMFDERELLPSQIRMISHIIYGGNIDSYPNPDIDGKGFLNFIRTIQEGTLHVYDPIDNQLHPWIKENELRRHIRIARCCTIL